MSKPTRPQTRRRTYFTPEGFRAFWRVEHRFKLRRLRGNPGDQIRQLVTALEFIRRALSGKNGRRVDVRHSVYFDGFQVARSVALYYFWDQP